MDEKEQVRIFRNNLVRLMAERSLTQKEVADAIGVIPQTFNTWTRGKAIPRMDKVQKLADYFCVRVSDLVDEAEEEVVVTRPDLIELINAVRGCSREQIDLLINIARSLK